MEFTLCLVQEWGYKVHEREERMKKLLEATNAGEDR
jgi:hypothetical protein